MSCSERILKELTTVRIKKKLLKKYRETNKDIRTKRPINLSRLLEDALRAELARRGVHDISEEE